MNRRGLARFVGMVVLFSMIAPSAVYAQGSGIGKAACGTDIAIMYSPTMLWPPNHKMETITIEAVDQETAPDTSSEPSGFSIMIAAITDNQHERAGQGCGAPTRRQGPDFAGVNNTASGADEGMVMTSVQVRAERCAHEGARVYDIKVECSDEGTTGTTDLNVIVPEDQRR